MDQSQFPSIETLNLVEKTMALHERMNTVSKTNFHLTLVMQQYLHDMRKPSELPRLERTAKPIGSAFREMLEKELAKRGVRR